MKFEIVRSWIALTLTLLTAALAYKFVGAPLTSTVFDSILDRKVCWLVGTLLTVGLPALVGYVTYRVVMRVGMK